MLAEMTVAAEELVEILKGYCIDDEIVIAGSMRRRKPNPGDIEIVADPIIHSSYTRDLFGEITSSKLCNVFDDACGKLLDDGTLSMRTDKNGRCCWGSGVKRAMYKGYKVDIFACIPPSTWGSTLAIRTGPGDFNKLLVTSARFEGACPVRRKVAGGRVWNLENALQYEAGYDFALMPAGKFLKVAEDNDAFAVIPTPTEEAFFAALDVPWWPPWERTVKRLQEFLRQERANSIAGMPNTHGR